MPVSADTVRELHRRHVQLADLRERAERGPKQLQARAAHLVRLSDELTRLQGEVKAAKVRADQKQLQLKSGEEKIMGLKAKLNACTTNREYQALKDQIAADQMAGSVLADEILEALEKIDELQKQVVEHQKVVVGVKDELGKAEQTMAEQSRVLSVDIQRLTAELAEAEAGLPEDFREEYLRVVRVKGADAMAEAQGEFCSGCCKQLTPNVMSVLMAGWAVPCKNCGRIVFLPENRAPAKR